jgi:hypothetical protein
LFEFSLGGKWLHLLKEIAPGLRRVAVMLAYNLTRALNIVGIKPMMAAVGA